MQHVDAPPPRMRDAVGVPASPQPTYCRAGVAKRIPPSVVHRLNGGIRPEEVPLGDASLLPPYNLLHSASAVGWGEPVNPNNEPRHITRACATAAIPVIPAQAGIQGGVVGVPASPQPTNLRMRNAVGVPASPQPTNLLRLGSFPRARGKGRRWRNVDAIAAFCTSSIRQLRIVWPGAIIPKKCSFIP